MVRGLGPSTTAGRAALPPRGVLAFTGRRWLPALASLLLLIFLTFLQPPLTGLPAGDVHGESDLACFAELTPTQDQSPDESPGDGLDVPGLIAENPMGVSQSRWTPEPGEFRVPQSVLRRASS